MKYDYQAALDPVIRQASTGTHEPLVELLSSHTSNQEWSERAMEYLIDCCNRENDERMICNRIMCMAMICDRQRGIAASSIVEFAKHKFSKTSEHWRRASSDAEAKSLVDQEIVSIHMLFNLLSASRSVKLLEEMAHDNADNEFGVLARRHLTLLNETAGS